MGHRGGGGHQSHANLHAAKARAKGARRQEAKKARGGMSRTQLRKAKKGQKKS